MRSRALSRRAAAARRAVLLSAAVSRRSGFGGGSTIGGHVGLALDPGLLGALGANRPIALVSGTNGKTTTTRLLAEALGGPGRVATSSAGANMAAGIVSALAADLTSPGVLEVDEGYLGLVDTSLHPSLIVLLNLSRDQLDRVSEVRMVAQRWREALAGTSAVVLANADDPLVVFAAELAPQVIWAGAGGLWHLDAHHCPHCEGPIEFAADGSWSSPCGFARPALAAALDREELVLADGRRLPVRTELPGRFNTANAALAALGAEALGVDLGAALESIRAVREVAGRFSVHELDGAEVRLLLAKNPAGWTELIGLLATEPAALVVAINAQDADGHDPSWLWDVPFESLAGHRVIATGERWRDLSVRLQHAGIEHESSPDQLRALGLAGTGRVEYVGNYTAFQELRRRLDARPAGRAHSLPATGHGAPRLAPRPGRPVVGITKNAGPSALRVVAVHPDLLGTYGDVGNARILANRALWRGIEVELVLAGADEPLPSSGDIYCLGGGEDGPQVQSAAALREGSLARAVAGGAVVFAVCAGYQIIGEGFPGPTGELVAGVGLLDVSTVRGGGRRAVGELAVGVTGLELPPDASPLSGFENHGGRTILGAGTQPLGRVSAGVGNGSGTDGARSGKVIGTYLHGPALARNPALADALLGLALGRVLEPLPDEEEQALRRERLEALDHRSRRARLGRVRAGR